MATDRYTVLKHAIALSKLDTRFEVPARFHGVLGEVGWANFLTWYRERYRHCANCVLGLLFPDTTKCHDVVSMDDYTADET